MKNLIFIWALLLPYLAFGQATNSDTQYRNDGETLINGSFEQGKKGYTFTVGSGSTVWSAQSTTKLTGRAMQLTLSAQTFSFKSATTQGVSLQNQNGYIEVYLSASLSGAEMCPVVDGVSAPTTTPNECQPIIAGVGFRPYGIQKVFGASSLNYEIRGVSNAAYTGVIYADDGSISKKSIVTQNNSPRLIGTITWATAASCVWSLTNTAYTNFPADTDCPTPTVTGSIVAPGTKIPALVIPSYSAGTYKFEASGGFFQGATNTTIGFRFNDGTNFSKGSNSIASEVLGVQVGSGVALGIIENPSSQNNITVNLQGSSSTGAVQIENSGRLRELSIAVWYYPPQPTSTINSSNGWLIDANIGGANPDMSANSSYTEITNTGLDLVINTSKGSALAEIPCASGTASVGLTCNTPAVAESVGISFVPPKTGKYRACFDVTHRVNASTNVYTTLQVVETSNTSSAVVTEGGVRTASGSTSSVTNDIPHRTCGTFTFNDTSKKTLRLMYEQYNTGLNQSALLADREVVGGQRDIHVTVEPIIENIQASLQSYTSTPNTINPKICAFGFGAGTYRTPCTSGTCTIYQQSSSCGVVVTRFIAGGYNYTFPANTWNGSNYFCGPVGLPNYVSGAHAPQQYETVNKTDTVFTARFNNSAGDSDVAANIICYGQGN